MMTHGPLGHEAPGLMQPPGPRLGQAVPLDFVRRRKTRGRRSTYAELNLTSMVDMLTILVVFLLQTFSTSGELSVSRDIKLPAAVNHAAIEQAPIIAISRDVVTLNGYPMADTAELLRGDSIDWKLPRLYDELSVLRNNFKLVHAEPGAWQGLLLVQADQGVDFKVLKKVMYTCAAAGYDNLSFAVQPAGKGG